MPNSDVDNGGAEPKDLGVGIFRPPRRLVRATDVHVGISRSFFYSVGCARAEEGGGLALGSPPPDFCFSGSRKSGHGVGCPTKLV